MKGIKNIFIIGISALATVILAGCVWNLFISDDEEDESILGSLDLKAVEGSFDSLCGTLTFELYIDDDLGGEKVTDFTDIGIQWKRATNQSGSGSEKIAGANGTTYTFTRADMFTVGIGPQTYIGVTVTGKGKYGGRNATRSHYWGSLEGYYSRL